jgi:RNA polymerase sigma-70 factor (ECF subfamily)
MKNPGSDSGPALLRQVLATLHTESWAWALNCCDRHRADAEDVLQATYLKILDGRARFDGRASVLTWVFAVIRRTAADHRRRRFARSLLRPPPRAVPGDAGAFDVDDAVASPESQLATKQAREAVLSALAALARRQREVVMLVYYHDLTVQQAATVMGVSVGAARQHYARGKRALHTVLESRGIRP